MNSLMSSPEPLSTQILHSKLGWLHVYRSAICLGVLGMGGGEISLAIYCSCQFELNGLECCDWRGGGRLSCGANGKSATVLFKSDRLCCGLFVAMAVRSLGVDNGLEGLEGCARSQALMLEFLQAD